MERGPSLQERYAPQSICFGCGPANASGLQLQSYVEGETLVAHWRGQPYHHAFPGVLNGGILSTLLDCHCNWTAAYFLLQRDALRRLPSTVTAELTVRMLRPTPLDATLKLVGTIERLGRRSAVSLGELQVDGVVTATCRATFVAVEEGHPAFHRW